MKLFILAALGVAAGAVPANAAVTLSSVTPGSATYAGPAPTYDFDTSTPTFLGGKIASGTTQAAAMPLGGTGSYYAVDPTNGPGTISLASFGAISKLSFIWGSVDTGNVLSFLDAAGNALYTITGQQLAGATADGSRSAGASNPIVTFDFTGSSQTVAGMQLTALPGVDNPSGYSFEIDNLAISAVPEVGTWGMMILGMGAIGFALRSAARRSERKFDAKIKRITAGALA